MRSAEHVNLKGMFLMKLMTFGLFLIFGCSTWAQSENYNIGLLGELDGGVYSGPWRPSYTREPYFGREVLSDDAFNKDFFFHQLWEEAPQISHFLNVELLGASTCPNEVLSEQVENLRYGYRLISMSFLFEILDELHRDSVMLKKAQSCTFNLQELINSCKPVSSEMKIFTKTVSGQALFTEPTVGEKYNHQSYANNWLEQIKKGGNTVGTTRLHSQCVSDEMDCNKLTPSDAFSLLSKACNEDKELIIQICSEKDHLYGVSSVPAVSHLLASSNLMSLYNKEGFGQGCLRRFGQLMSSHERVPLYFATTVPLVSTILSKKSDNETPQGRAFVFGALKEYREKGLAEVFETKVEPDASKPVVAIEEPKPEPKVEVKEVPKADPKPVVVAKAPKPKVLKKPEIEIIPKSAFLLASEVRRSQALARVDVDMLKFQYDYVYNSAEIQVLSSSLKEYTTREALKEMQSFDKLGTQASPVPLTFVKYLIDSSNHQGLYNLTAVLGESFWVTNDVDRKWKVGPEFVELKNDDSTSRQWQIYILGSAKN